MACKLFLFKWGQTSKIFYQNFRCSGISYYYSSNASHNEGTFSAYLCGDDRNTLKAVSDTFKILQDFINEEEEQSLMNEIETGLRRRRYEFDHWDGAIHGYRETERVNWSDANQRILQKVRDFAFAGQEKQLPHVHVLDLADKGLIKPHIDSVKFCGDTIAGLSLLSSSIMRLVNEENKSQFVDAYLQQRSLYIMTGSARYNFTHEVLGHKESYFKGMHIPRARRVSIIFRNAPVEEKT